MAAFSKRLRGPCNATFLLLRCRQLIEAVGSQDDNIETGRPSPLCHVGAGVGHPLLYFRRQDLYACSEHLEHVLGSVNPMDFVSGFNKR